MTVTLVCKPYDYRLVDAKGRQVGGSFTNKVAAEKFAEKMGYKF